MITFNKPIVQLGRAAMIAAVAGGTALTVSAHDAQASHAVYDWVCHS